LDRGELLSEEAIREVFEETGVRLEYMGIIAFREKKNYNFRMNDIIFIALLKPLSLEVNIVRLSLKQFF
jgi:ADP-ribose pyrophosphatase YjhB (NUDIX family)